MKYISVLFFTAVSLICRADEPRYQTTFASKNEKYTLELNGEKSKWDLKNQQSQIIYSIDNIARFASMTACVSEDGKKVVFVDDFMEEHQIGDRKVLYFFNKGALTRSYTFPALLDTCNVSYSVWHVRWLVDFGFTKNDSVFLIATYRFDEFEFNSDDGAILVKKKPPEFTDDAVIVFGEFDVADSGTANMTILKYVAGPKQPDNKITFYTKRHSAGSHWRATRIIRDGRDITPSRYRHVLTNSCLIRE